MLLLFAYGMNRFSHDMARIKGLVQQNLQIDKQPVKTDQSAHPRSLISLCCLHEALDLGYQYDQTDCGFGWLC